MIPVRLTFEGLYSYRESTSIDFTRLCEARLFGIFGPVGSGKSSILEAITYALYGETERLNAKEGRNYNMMNLKASRLWVDFEFMAGAEGADRYRFTVELRRNSKRFSDVGAPKRLAYKQAGNEWIPLPHTDAAQILGIRYEHFIKTIIIPQGRFQDFLGMTAGDRTKMLKELFELQRFDLSRPTAALISRNNSDWDKVRGQLGEVAMVSDEEIEAQTTRLAQLEQELLNADARQKQLTAQDKDLGQLKSLIGELQEILDFLSEYEEDEPEFEARAKNLDRHRHALQFFKDLIGQEKQFAQAREIAEQKQKKYALELEQANQQFQRAEADFEVPKQRYERREEVKAKEEEMRRMAQMRECDMEVENLKSRLQKGSAMVQENVKATEQLRSSILSLANDLSGRKKALPDTFALQELQQWHLERKQLQNRLDQAHRDEQAAESARQQAESALKALLPDPDSHPDRAEPLLLSQRQALQERLSHLRTHLRLSEFAAELHAGEPCPLCGATAHPHPMNAGETGAELAAAEAELLAVEAALRKTATLRNALGIEQARLQERERTHTQAQAARAEADSRLQAHMKAFRWEALGMQDAAAVEAAIAAAKSAATAIQQDEKALEKQRETLAEAEKAIQNYQAGIQRLENEMAGLNGRFSTLQAQIKIFNYEKDRHHPVSEFIAKADRFKEEYEEVTQAYHRADKARLQALDLQGRLSTELRLAEQSASDARISLEKSKAEIAARLAKSPFQNRDDLEAVLGQSLDVAREEAEIASFREKMANARKDYALKLSQVGERNYDAELHAAIQAESEALKQHVSNLSEEKGTQRNELERLRQQQSRHKDLLKQHEFLARRAEDLNTLSALFRADGFVNYVSSVYLRELCQRANERFQALTRNRLSLEINDDNAFEVRDMVNDGQKRSVKTLSGGQTFQAALCLALALADNIQMRTQGKHNFFFLDEGFGSLDRESLQVVFDTLKALRRENRVVGVISHVEELQQEIDVNLRIRVDEERGSLIEVN